jgi:hypothetical protein
MWRAVAESRRDKSRKKLNIVRRKRHGQVCCGTECGCIMQVDGHSVLMFNGFRQKTKAVDSIWRVIMKKELHSTERGELNSGKYPGKANLTSR